MAHTWADCFFLNVILIPQSLSRFLLYSESAGSLVWIFDTGYANSGRAPSLLLITQIAQCFSCFWIIDAVTVKNNKVCFIGWKKMGDLFPEGKYRWIGLDLHQICVFSLGTLTVLKTSFGYMVRLSPMSPSPHERNQSLQWEIEKLPTQTREEEAPGGLCQRCLQRGFFFTTQTRIACRVSGWKVVVWGGEVLHSTFQEQSHISVLPKR